MTDWMTVALTIIVLFSLLIALRLHRWTKQQKDNVEKSKVVDSSQTLHENTDHTITARLMEADCQLLLEKISKVNEQLVVLFPVIEKTKEQLELSAQMLQMLDEIKHQLEDLTTKRQPRRLDSVDKQFIEEKIAQWAGNIKVTLDNLNPMNNSVSEEKIGKVLDQHYTLFLQKLENVFDAHGYKDCKNCGFSTVPKKANFCPECGQNPDAKRASESA